MWGLTIRVFSQAGNAEHTTVLIDDATGVAERLDRLRCSDQAGQSL
jgi:hypothetical protein